MQQGRFGLAFIFAFFVSMAAQAVAAPQLVFSVLPSSRSVPTTGTANAFVSVINAGDTIATDVAISLSSKIPAQFEFQTTDPATNALTGSPNLPVDIAPGDVQTFVIAIRPTGPIASQEVQLRVAGSNTSAIGTTIGVDTLRLSAASNPPDVIALGATTTGDGIVSIINPGQAAAFAVATFNIGSASSIVASVDRGSGSYPANLAICETNATTGQCLNKPGASVVSQMGTNATRTFGVFITSTGPIPFNPAANRVFVRFRDASGVVRGATSVAVRTTGAGKLQIAARDEQGAAAPGIYKVLLNGAIVGETDASGQFTRTVPAVPTAVRLQNSALGGNGLANVPANGSVQLNVTVASEGSVDDVGLSIVQASGGVVPSSAAAFMMRLPGRQVAQLTDVYLQSPNLDFVDRVTTMFGIGAGGTVQATSPNFSSFKSLVTQRAAVYGHLQMEVVGIDGNGLSFVATGSFNLGTATLTGRLRPPPSKPTVPVAKIPVFLTMGDRGVNLKATTDSGGNFVINNVPTGTISLDAATTFQGFLHTAEAAFTFTGATTVELTFNSSAAGDPLDSPLKVLKRGADAAFGPQQMAERQALDRSLAVAPPQATATSATAVGGPQDVTITDEVTCALPTVTQARTVSIKYIISTTEYPYYVLKQSQYDDRWSVTATLPNGTPVFKTGLYSVNSQISKQPIWLSNGSTGNISVPVAIPANVNALKLKVTSVNIGDSALATTATVNCPSSAELRFDKEMVEDAHKGTVRNISLPRPDTTQSLATNKRHATLKFTPKDMQIDLNSVQLVIKNENGKEFNVGKVEAKLLGAGSLQILTTFGFGNPASPFSGLGAPDAKFIRYKVKANGKVSGQNVTLEAESKVLGALWRAKEVKEAVGIFGTSLPDHDDWATSCTDTWLKANKSQLPAMNDISAHHGRKPFSPHSSHTRGRHVDMFHFYASSQLGSPAPGVGSGGKYYQNLANQARIYANPASTAQQKTAALAILRAWTQATRAKAKTLFATGGVGQIVYAIGSAIPSSTPKAPPLVPGGWARALVLEGKLPDGTVDKTLGTWIEDRYKTNSDHNDHTHIDLMRYNLQNGCDVSPG